MHVGKEYGKLSAFLTTEGLSDCMSRPRKLGITKVGLEVDGSKMVNRLPKRCRVAKWRRQRNSERKKNRMKKLMIGAAVAAITVGAFAGACDETVKACAAWDVKFNLKTLTPKKTNCGKDVCGEDLGTVYYLDSASRKIEGYLWACEYDCAESSDYNVTLWDKKNKKAVIAYDPSAPQQIAVPGDDILVYGKKATKVAGTFEFAGTDDVGDDAFEVTAAGINGKFHKDSDKCYIKSLSGYAAGKVKLYLPSVTAKGKAGTLCDDPEPCEEPELNIRVALFCDACCWSTWCDDTYAYEESLVPAAGTWSMKYNKKVSKGTKSMSALVPAYAL